LTSNAAILRRVLEEEASAINSLAGHLDERFDQAVKWIVECTGRVITCGVGKSGHVARKTAGTLSSTGTPSLFLHAAEALHGDLGGVTANDIVLAYSHSGETEEILRLYPSLSLIGARTVLITGRGDSSAARLSDLVLDTGVEREACSINLAPTTSTTVMLALSDALAVAAMEIRGFRKEDFAVFHPNGSLGKRLLLKVRDVMRAGSDNAIVPETTTVHEVMFTITRANAGAACIVDGTGRMTGIVSDGDLRRHFVQSTTLAEARDVPCGQIMSRTFQSIGPEMLASEALEFFQNLPMKIGEIPVVDENQNPLGMLVLKDLLRSGIV